ncbi:MAG: L-histidine N-alpha-methyltransferase [Spirosomataceae bacterium]|jgi:dimethylhistidine N-methyltransferase
MNNAFLKDMLKGLSSTPKTLSSRYFYDAIGDGIFQEIMQMKEYYLPACELEIIQKKTKNIAAEISAEKIDVIELGAGDGTKTVYFLKGLIDAGKEITYIPLDISANVLEINREHISARLPDLIIESIAGDYFETMKSLKERNNPKIVLFMGSNIGNFKDESAVDFLKLVKSYMTVGDTLLVGADLKKNPKTILAAYNDKSGITKRFNLNLLARMNRELGADFTVADFDHYAFYDPASGTSFSYIVSLENQTVNIADETISFSKNECIHTEVSQKYSLEDLERISSKAGFAKFTPFLDSKEWFCLGLMA